MKEREKFLLRLYQLGLKEVEFEESFCRSTGPGGQHVNKVSTAVELRHRPTGLAVTVQDSRSQALNRRLARERLLDAIEARQRSIIKKEKARKERLRRQKAQRPPAVKRQMLEEKRRRSVLKDLRKTPESD